MAKIKSNLLKVCALVFSVCAVFAVATYSIKANAEEVSTFEVVQEADIRVAEEGVAGGLRFTTNVDDAWFTANGTATFGTLIFPAKNGSVDKEASVKDNVNELSAVDIGAVESASSALEFKASLVFDDAYIQGVLAGLGKDAEFDYVKYSLLAMDFTAVAYAELSNGNVVYSNAYTTSMLKTAIAKYLADNTNEAALAYLGNVTVQSVSANTFSAGVLTEVAEVLNYTASGSVIVSTPAETIALNAGESLTLAPSDLGEDKEGQIIIYGNGATEIYNVVYKDIVVKDVVNYDAIDGAFVDGDIMGSTPVQIYWNGDTYLPGDTVSADSDETVLKYQTIGGVETFVGIRGKISTSDTLPGITYVVKTKDTDYNKAQTQTLTEFYIDTEDAVYQITKINYWTKVIRTVEDLVWSLDKDFTMVSSSTATRANEKGMHFNVRSKKERGFNAGYYRLYNDIDFLDAEGNYTSTFTGVNVASTANYGGFTGWFDGFGYSILNFKSTKNGGLFGQFRSVDSASGPTTYLRGATVQNLGIEDVVTENGTPVITAGMYATETRAQTIKNVYVKYAKNITGAAGILLNVTKDLTMNNVLVEYAGDDEGNYANMVKVTNNPEFDLDSSVEWDDGLYMRQIPSSKESIYHGGSLFGNIIQVYTSALYGVVAESDQANIKNIIVNSKLPILHKSSSDYPGTRYTYIKSTGPYFRENYHLGGTLVKNTDTGGSTFYRQFGLAINETECRVLSVNGIRTSIVDEVAAGKATYGGTNAYSSWVGYLCECGYVSKVANLGGKLHDCNGDGTADEGEGVFTEIKGYQGLLSTHYGYKHTIIKAGEAGTYFQANNGAVKFLGVLRFDDSAAMAEYHQANGGVSGFTSAYWNVSDDGVVTWKGAN